MVKVPTLGEVILVVAVTGSDLALFPPSIEEIVESQHVVEIPQ